MESSIMSSQEKSSPMLHVGGNNGSDDPEIGQSGLFLQTNSPTCSIGRESLSPSLSVLPSQIDDDIDSEIVSEAGDVGNRALPSNRTSRNGSPLMSFDLVTENSVVDSIAKDRSPVSPFSIDIIVKAKDKIHNNTRELPKLLEYASCLIHLAVFGIFGVLTRYLLQKLFGPGVAGVTSNENIIYPDLPANMFGSFLMGWWGIVFKQDISDMSEFLAIGLSTGFLGSLTTFSGWNQKMLELCFQENLVSALIGFLVGLFLAAYSVIFGVETAKGFRHLLERNRKISGILSSSSSWRVDSCKKHIAIMVVLMVMLCLLWSVSGVWVKEDFISENGEGELWIACLVGPFGVWIRWFLARMNGRGLGKEGYLKWIPFGTLSANVSAACIMASLSTLTKEVNSKSFDSIATGIQFGYLGCLSTVSTFIAEFNAMRESKHPWRAYAYAMITIGLSFGLGTLIYTVPVWTRRYK